MWVYQIATLLTRGAWVGGLILSALVALLWFYQEKLLFFPGVPKGFETPDRNPKGLRNPSERNLPYDDVYFTTADGVHLHGWHLKQPSAFNAPTILYFHGNAGNIGFRLPNIEHMYKLIRVNILIVSYRGYGYSEGRPSEKGVYLDAEASLEFLRAQPSVDSKSIFVFGRSIGGAVAIDLAHNKGHQLRGIIVENTFTSLLDMLYIVFPFLRPFAPAVRMVQRMYMRNFEKVRTLALPILFISGRQDQLVPPAHMDLLFDTCSSRVKLREDVARGGHNDTWEVGGASYYARMRSFLETALDVPFLGGGADEDLNSSEAINAKKCAGDLTLFFRHVQRQYARLYKPHVEEI